MLTLSDADAALVAGVLNEHAARCVAGARAARGGRLADELWHAAEVCASVGVELLDRDGVTVGDD